MRLDILAPTDPTLLNRSGVTVTLYPTATPFDLIAGTLGLTTRDLTNLASQITQSDTGASIRLDYLNELSGTNAPQPGQMVRIALSGTVVFQGIISQISAVIEQRGSRSLTLALQRRDSMPAWRDTHRVGSQFTVGVDLASFVIDAATALALDPIEYAVPPTGVLLAHDTAQLADVSAWDAATLAWQPSLQEPFVDALGVLKPINRVINRAPDLTLTPPQIQNLNSAVSRPPITNVRVLWLDPTLTQVTQLAQVLQTVNSTCGFFQPFVRTDVYYSTDRTQQAKNVYMVTRQSANQGILSALGVTWVSESLAHGSDFYSVLHQEINAWTPALATLGIAGLIAAALDPDGVQVGISGTGFTIPFGRTFQQIALNEILIVMMTIGTGVYEIWGTPFDWVHQVNQSEAYDQNAPDYAQKLSQIRNDLIPSETVASGVAVNELLYQARAAGRGSAVIADDLRIEPGDVLGIPDGRKFYVTGYSRSLTRGADPLLNLSGFLT